MRRAPRVLASVLAPAVFASGCLTAAKVFLDIPESVESAESSGGRIPEELLERIQLKPTPPPPPEIESVTDPDSVLRLLPADHSGGVDWVAAVSAGVIRPRAGDSEQAPDSLGDFSYDLYLGDGGGPEAYFPHSAHRAWMNCVSCHPRVYRNGAESATAETAHGATSCGNCHGTVAFPIQACERCHESARDLPRDRREKEWGGEGQLQRISASRFGDRGTSYPPATFPHNRHRLRFQCRACHERPFAMARGAAALSETEAHSTRGCGKCHDGAIAFAIDLGACGQCHVVDSG